MRISDWSSDVCSSDLRRTLVLGKISPLGSVQRLPRRTRDLRRQLRRGRRRQMLSKLRVHPPTFGDPRIGILAGPVHQQHEPPFSLVGVVYNASVYFSQGACEHPPHHPAHIPPTPPH